MIFKQRGRRQAVERSKVTRCARTAAVAAQMTDPAAMRRMPASVAEACIAAAFLVIGNTVLRDVARRLQLRMGLNDSLTEQLCFEVECEAAQTPVVRKALEEVLTQRHGALRSVGETRTAKGTTLLSAIAAFESPDLRADIGAILSAGDMWNVVNVSWQRQYARIVSEPGW